jgi:ribose-phosphate pyrophosphokinase
VGGKDVIILDDEIATAGSVVELIETVRRYHVNSISVACTHGLFTGKAVERLNAVSDIVEIVATDTVPAPTGLDRLTTVSVAPLFAEAVRRINCGESVSGLFSDEDTYGE